MLVLLAASMLSLLVPLPMKGLLSMPSKSVTSVATIICCWLCDLLMAMSLSADRSGLQTSSSCTPSLYEPPTECCELSMLREEEAAAEEGDASLTVWMKSNREPLLQNSVTSEIAGGMIATP